VRAPRVTEPDTTGQFRDEDRPTGRKLGEPFGEVGSGFLYGPLPGPPPRRDRDSSGAAKLRSPPRSLGVARSCLTNDEFVSHDDRGSQMG
jgi:hypothetical protein